MHRGRSADIGRRRLVPRQLTIAGSPRRLSFLPVWRNAASVRCSAPRSAHQRSSILVIESVASPAAVASMRKLIRIRREAPAPAVQLILKIGFQFVPNGYAQPAPGASRVKYGRPTGPLQVAVSRIRVGTRGVLKAMPIAPFCPGSSKRNVGGQRAGSGSESRHERRTRLAHRIHCECVSIATATAVARASATDEHAVVGHDHGVGACVGSPGVGSRESAVVRSFLASLAPGASAIACLGLRRPGRCRAAAYRGFGVVCGVERVGPTRRYPRIGLWTSAVAESICGAGPGAPRSNWLSELQACARPREAMRGARLHGPRT